MVQGLLFSDDDLSPPQATAHAALRADRRKQYPCYVRDSIATMPTLRREKADARLGRARRAHLHPAMRRRRQRFGDFDSCLTEFRTNRCTLNGDPTIEPVDLDAEPIRCCWDIVDLVMQNGGDFVREDDDTGD